MTYDHTTTFLCIVCIGVFACTFFVLVSVHI